MAAPQAPAAELRELAGVRPAELDSLFDEEIAAWRRHLDWDFSPSAALIRHYIEARALSGYALSIAGRLVGYAYQVADEQKSLIGDLYLMEDHATPDHECLLLGAVLGAAMRTRGVRRIESQLMLLRSAHDAPLPGARFLQAYPRNLMLADLAAVRDLPPRHLAADFLLDLWTDRRQDDAAQLIVSAYRDHLDSQINDQYRTPAGARRFLHNIVQYPGCGSFFPPACWVALDRCSGRLCGICLASLVARDVGHITQICLSPAARGKGLGYELLRRSMASVAQSGASRLSLTVTAANLPAMRLYLRMGFRVLRHFPALVWQVGQVGTDHTFPGFSSHF